MKFLDIEISSNFFLERTALEMFRWGCSDPARIRCTPMTKNATSRPEKPRNSVLPEDGVKKRYKAQLTNQRRERGSNVKVYSCVPLCGAEPWRYTVFWRLPKYKCQGKTWEILRIPPLLINFIFFANRNSSKNMQL